MYVYLKHRLPALVNRYAQNLAKQHKLIPFTISNAVLSSMVAAVALNKYKILTLVKPGQERYCWDVMIKKPTS
jgi:hypothetical protein